MRATATLLDDDFRRLTKQLSELTGKPFHEQLKAEAGLVALDLLRKTPPKSKGIGVRAIRRDVRKSFKEFWPERLRSPEHQSLVRQGKVEELRALFARWRVKYKDWTFHRYEDAPRLHGRARSYSTRRGIYRVAGTARKRYVLVDRKGKIEREYLKPILARVGSLKAGWLHSLRMLNRKAPSWVSKAEKAKGSKARGDFKESPPQARDHMVALINATPTMAAQEREIQFVNQILKSRVAKMKRRIQKTLESTGRGKAVL